MYLRERICLRKFLADFKKHSFLLQYLITKDFKIKYRRSVLGIAWSVLNPLFMMIVVSTVFQIVIKANIGDYCYPVYVILGQTMFAFLTDATNSAMTSILSASALIKKVYIPKYIFPLEKVSFAFVNFIISMVAVILVGLFFRIKITFLVLLTPLLFIVFYFFCLGLGLLLSVITVFFRDMVHIQSIILTAWMYLTPIFYDISLLVGDGALGKVWWQRIVIRLFEYNPMYQYINCFRNLVLFGRMPTLTEVGLCVGYAALALVIGAFAFNKKQDKFILYI